MIGGAAELMELHRLNFYDALIVAAATSANCTGLLSEDMQNGRMIRGVIIRNPFL